MATVAYSIKADVVDIRVDKPRSDDTLLVDTNVWLGLPIREPANHPNRRLHTRLRTTALRQECDDSRRASVLLLSVVR